MLIYAVFITSFRLLLSLLLFVTMKHISEETYNSIISLLDNNFSSRQIATQLCVSHTTVNTVRAQARPDIQKQQAGRPAKLTATDKRRIVRLINSGKVSTAVQLTKELKDTTAIEVGVDTVRRALKDAGMKALSKKKKPRLLPKHIREHHNFAL